jgi:hypothetical protein
MYTQSYVYVYMIGYTYLVRKSIGVLLLLLLVSQDEVLRHLWVLL